MEFRLLGPLEVLSEGRSLRIGGSKQRGVLAVLLLHANEVVSTDRLIDEIWGARPPKSVDASLQNCVSHLRNAIGRDTIETRAPGYRLVVEPDSIDALRFERALEAARSLAPAERAAALREALALWRGPPLADLELEGVARAAVARLDELRLSALEERIDAELALGHHDEILGEIEALAGRNPARERLRQLQMLALYRAGRQRDALRVYQEVRLELVEDFGLEPSEALRTLERKIISHDPSLRLAPALPAEPLLEALHRNVVMLMMEVVELDGVSASARRAAASLLAEIALVVERHGGTVHQLHAEELVAVFGAPHAHDDDTLRALRAVVEARNAVPPRFVVRAAVERYAGDGDADVELDALRGLLARAGAGDLLLGPAALQLVPAAVDVVPHESGAGYRVLRFNPEAEPFPRHFEAPIVGRAPELGLLAAAFQEAVRAGVPRRVAVLGDAGIGKTRLARAFVAQIGAGAHVVTTHCPSYGDGAALQPLLEIVEQLGPLEPLLAAEPDARRISAALPNRSLSEPSEGFWAVRRLLEASAGDRPVVIVIEDMHLAAPALLDFVDYLAGWAAAPLFLVCAARPELLDVRPEWRDAAIVLEPIEQAEAEQLAAALPESAGLDASVVAAAVAAAEGNPLFLEQLISFAAEDRLASLPPTVEVLIASRIARLPEAERAVVDRAAVAGRHFWRSTIEEVSPARERPGVGMALMALVRRRLVRPERALLAGEDGFRFQHALICDAVYAGIPERTRAELHENVARSLEARSADLEETVGYHLERSARLRASSGSPSPELVHEAGARLGAAGIRSLKRVDGVVAVDLLTRALDLLRGTGTPTLELECARAMAVKFTGDAARADGLLEEVIERSVAAGDARNEHLARVEQVWWRLGQGALTPAEGLRLAERARAVFEEADDDFGLGRAWHCTAVVDAVYSLRYELLETTVARVHHHYSRSGFAPGSSIFLLAAAASRGPLPVKKAIVRCRTLAAEAGSPVWRSFILPMLAVLEAMDGRFDDARALLEEARLDRQEFADTGTIVTSWSALAADVELLAGDPSRAEEILAGSCEVLRAAGEREWLATNSAMLSDALYRQQRYAEALQVSSDALTTAPPSHLTSLAIARRVHAQALARDGRVDDALDLITESIASLEHTGVLIEQGAAFAAAAEVEAIRGRREQAQKHWARAEALFEQKGAGVLADRVRAAAVDAR